MGPVRVGNQAFEHFQHDVYGNIVLGASQAFSRPSPVPARRSARLRHARARRRPGVAAARAARRRHVGAAHARARPHLVVADVLGRLRPAGQGRVALALPERARTGASAPTTIRAAHPRVGLERAAPRVRREFRRQGPRRQRAADGRGRLPRPARPALRQHRRRARSARWPTARSCAATRRPTTSACPRTAFNVCAFWRVDALARIGRTEQARESFEALLAHRNPMGLLSEDIDPKRASCGATSRRPTRWWASSIARCSCRRRGIARSRQCDTRLTAGSLDARQRGTDGISADLCCAATIYGTMNAVPRRSRGRLSARS